MEEKCKFDLEINSMKKSSLRIFCFALVSYIATHANSEICHLRCEYLINPISIDIATPRFSWETSVDQEYYQLQTAADIKLLENDKVDIWQSEKLSGKANSIVYEGKPLKSHSTYYWQVTVWDNKSKKIISPIAQFETAKMSSSDRSRLWHHGISE